LSTELRWPQGNVVGFISYFQLLKRALRAAPREVALDQLRPIFKVFLEAFDIAKLVSSASLEVSFPSFLCVPSHEASKAEAQAISAFLELVVKLNEATFRPIFRRLYDWAFANDGGKFTMTGRCNIGISRL
jgi:U3 small nucleolar RNA-associated protein 10